MGQRIVKIAQLANDKAPFIECIKAKDFANEITAFNTR